jgi:glyceraldehyde-3-phosphate dehydrogenase (NADP+)
MSVSLRSISGSGREMMSPIMASGLLDCLGFIGTNAAADALQKAHPAPHRLRVCLGLDAKVLVFDRSLVAML